MTLCATRYAGMQPTGYSQTIRFLFFDHPVLVVLHLFVAQDRRPGPLLSLSYFCTRHWIQLHGMTSFLGDWSTITFCRPDITATISANAQHYCHAYLAMATTTQDTLYWCRTLSWYFVILLSTGNTWFPRFHYLYAFVIDIDVFTTLDRHHNYIRTMSA